MFQMFSKIIVLKRIVLSLFFILFLSSYPALCQCDFSHIVHREMETGYTYVKAHEISYSKKSQEVNTYSVIFSRGVQYKIVLHDSNPRGKKMLIDLLDHNDNLITTNFDPEHPRTYYPEILFDCKATGNYHLQFRFQDATTGCGVATISVKRM